MSQKETSIQRGSFEFTNQDMRKALDHLNALIELEEEEERLRSMSPENPFFKRYQEKHSWTSPKQKIFNKEQRCLELSNFNSSNISSKEKYNSNHPKSDCKNVDQRNFWSEKSQDHQRKNISLGEFNQSCQSTQYSSNGKPPERSSIRESSEEIEKQSFQEGWMKMSRTETGYLCDIKELLHKQKVFSQEIDMIEQENLNKHKNYYNTQEQIVQDYKEPFHSSKSPTRKSKQNTLKQLLRDTQQQRQGNHQSLKSSLKSNQVVSVIEQIKTLKKQQSQEQKKNEKTNNLDVMQIQRVSTIKLNKDCQGLTQNIRGIEESRKRSFGYGLDLQEQQKSRRSSRSNQDSQRQMEDDLLRKKKLEVLNQQKEEEFQENVESQEQILTQSKKRPNYQEQCKQITDKVACFQTQDNWNTLVAAKVDKLWMERSKQKTNEKQLTEEIQSYDSRDDQIRTQQKQEDQLVWLQQLGKENKQLKQVAGWKTQGLQIDSNLTFEPAKIGFPQSAGSLSNFRRPSTERQLPNVNPFQPIIITHYNSTKNRQPSSFKSEFGDILRSTRSQTPCIFENRSERKNKYDSNRLSSRSPSVGDNERLILRQEVGERRESIRWSSLMHYSDKSITDQARRSEQKGDNPDNMVQKKLNTGEKHTIQDKRKNKNQGNFVVFSNQKLHCSSK